jgi:acyl carrier protein
MPPSLIELVATVLDVSPDQLVPQTGPKTLTKWDSLAHVTIVAAVEQTYDVQLTMPEILSVQSIKDLEAVLRRHGVTPAVRTED